MSLCLCLSLVIVIVLHQICQKRGHLCLHVPSTDFVHSQLRVNMTQNHNF